MPIIIINFKYYFLHWLNFGYFWFYFWNNNSLRSLSQQRLLEMKIMDKPSVRFKLISSFHFFPYGLFIKMVEIMIWVGCNLKPLIICIKDSIFSDFLSQILEVHIIHKNYIINFFSGYMSHHIWEQMLRL